MSFGMRLKSLRALNQFTQKEVSERTGIAIRHYQDLEAENHNPGLGSLLSLADLYGVSVDYLLDRQDLGGAERHLKDYSDIAEIRSMVFVRAFVDMNEEKTELFKAFLEVESIPVCMSRTEHPRDEHLQQLVKKSISDSDYYMLVLSLPDGTYSSEVTEAIEEEYRWATGQKKPCAVLLRQPYVDMVSPRIERLIGFFKNARPRIFLLDYWKSIEDLGKSVCRSVVQLRHRHPPVGWIRGNGITKEQLLREQELYRKIEKLEDSVKKFGAKA